MASPGRLMGRGHDAVVVVGSEQGDQGRRRRSLRSGVDGASKPRRCSLDEPGRELPRHSKACMGYLSV